MIQCIELVPPHKYSCSLCQERISSCINFLFNFQLPMMGYCQTIIKRRTGWIESYGSVKWISILYKMRDIWSSALLKNTLFHVLCYLNEPSFFIFLRVYLVVRRDPRNGVAIKTLEDLKTSLVKIFISVIAFRLSTPVEDILSGFSAVNQSSIFYILYVWR